MNNIKSRQYKMSFNEKITLSPFQKYYKFNRFPWKFLIHILLVIFTTYQALSMVSLRTSHSRAQHQVFKYILLDSDDESNSVPFYKLEQFTNNVKNVCSTLYNLNEKLLQIADISESKNSLQIYYSEFSLENAQQADVDIPDIQKCIKQPFDIDDEVSVKNFLNQITKMNFVSEGIKTFTRYSDSPDQQSCLEWTITIEYDFESYANIEATIDTQSILCEGQNTESTFGYNYVFIHSIVAVLAIISLALSTKYIYEVGKKYIKHKIIYENVQKQFNFHREEESKLKVRDSFDMQKLEQEEKKDSDDLDIEELLKDNKKWDDIGFFNKLKFFNLWIVVSIVGNIVQIIGCFIAILDTYMEQNLNVFMYKESIIGFGSMFAWIIMLNYLQYNKNVNLMTSTLQKASSNIFMFLLGVLPFFFGFVFLGQCIFWKYTKFEDTTTTIITLFSLSNGDIVNETFMDTWAEGILGQIYLIVFMILFFTAVQNVFITIIMEGYDDSKRDKSNEVKESEEEAQKLDQDVEPEEDNIIQNVGQSKSDKDMVLNKLRINTKRIKKILDEMESAYKKIGEAKLKREDKDYLIRVYHDNLDNLNRNLKFQLTTMGR
ncbi:hypothetical protein ABPG74_014052 [Tetrahymena malaccensis]